jgi:hypothetical protein
VVVEFGSTSTILEQGFQLLVGVEFRELPPD